VLKQAYFPTSESQRTIWFGHYIAKLPVHASRLGVSPDEVSGTILDLNYYKRISQDLVPAARKYDLEVTALRNSIANDPSAGLQPLPVLAVFEDMPAIRPSGILTRLFTQVQRIKLSDGYSESIGQDLGIIGSQKVDTHAYTEFSLVTVHGVNNDRVVIKFKKYGHDAVIIESRRNGGDWEHLMNATISPWNDDRPLLVANMPEIREYQLCWYDKDQAGNIFSPVQKITVGI